MLHVLFFNVTIIVHLDCRVPNHLLDLEVFALRITSIDTEVARWVGSLEAFLELVKLVGHLNDTFVAYNLLVLIV